MTITEVYDAHRRNATDINEHLPVLLGLAADCRKVVELGMRSGRSTSALLAGGANVTSVDIVENRPVLSTLREHCADRLTFVQTDSRAVVVPECDMLFIDTYHSGEVLRAELRRHESRVGRLIVLHDTETFGARGEGGGEGLNAAVDDFLEQNVQWQRRVVLRNNNGLTVLRRVG